MNIPIMTLLIITILIMLNTDDITYICITYCQFLPLGGSMGPGYAKHEIAKTQQLLKK
jgi:hypothetical protein